MDCQEAKQRLNSTNLFSDKELLKHLENCSECAHHSNAARLLNKAFLAMDREYKNETTPLNIVQSNVIEKLKYETNKKRGFMTQIKNEVSRRPKLAAGFVLTVAVFLFITLVPFSYTRIVGYEIAFSNVGPLEDGQLQKIDDELLKLGLNDVSVKVANSNINISPLPNRAIAENVAIHINSMIRKSVNLQIRTITEMVSGSLYAQVLEKNRTIEIDAKGKSTDEIREEIMQKLIAEGFSNPEVTVDKSGDSIIDIHVNMTDSSENKMRQAEFELQISEDSDSFEIPVMEKSSGELDIDMEGKTDAEIKALIEEKLAREGKEGAVVNVKSRPDGKKEITVDFEKKITK